MKFIEVLIPTLWAFEVLHPVEMSWEWYYKSNILSLFMCSYLEWMEWYTNNASTCYDERKRMPSCSINACVSWGVEALIVIPFGRLFKEWIKNDWLSHIVVGSRFQVLTFTSIISVQNNGILFRVYPICLKKVGYRHAFINRDGTNLASLASVNCQALILCTCHVRTVALGWFLSSYVGLLVRDECSPIEI